MESPREAQRLESKTDEQFSQANLLSSGLKRGMKALDVGCGTGAVTRTLAAITQSPTFGLDRSDIRIADARNMAASMASPPIYVVGAAESLPWEDHTFDFTWSRFLFEYLSNWRAALAEMMRVTRPGGIVVVADLDGQMTQFFPQPERFQRLLRRAMELLSGHGFDPEVGRKLYGAFRETGLQDVRSVAIPYQTYCGGLPPAALENWAQKLRQSAAYLGKLDFEIDWQQFSVELLQHLQSPNSFYYSTLILTTGVKPAAP